LNLEAAWQALERDDFRAAERAARDALAGDPGDAEAWYLLGSTWLFEGRYRDAVAPLAEALRTDGRRGIGYRLGHCYLALGEFGSAEEALQREVRAHPDFADAHNTLGVALVNQGRQEQALAAFLAALRIDQRHAEANNNAANALCELSRSEEAIPYLRRAVEAKPGLADAHHNLGLAMQSLQRHEEAIASFARAVAIAPQMPYALGSLVRSEIAICRWQDAEPHIAALRAQLREGAVPAVPFTVLAVSPSPEEQRRCAELYVRETLRGQPAPPGGSARHRHARIRLAYVSADFHEHATAALTARLFELHERGQFEVIGVSYGPDDGSAMRRRLIQAFDRFADVAKQSDAQAVKLLRDMELDIAVDLKGHTRGARLRIFAERAAPLQVSYLGFPGTLGAGFIDYVLADRVVIAPGDERFYAEQVVYLPDSYQVNDATRAIAQRTPSRAEMGLPEDAFVFCCFNNNFKVTPEVFDIWMRLLANVPASVLWLLEDNTGARRNLEESAAARGIDPARLVFASRMRHEQHLARHRLADLFLDTLPYNAHTTASDALWAGLPVLTCLGATFAGRVAASLLAAVGLPELVTRSLADYEALALKLARERKLLDALRERLARNRLTHPLFDTARFCTHIEAAYRRMWEIHQRGEGPRSFSVPAAG
jgi:protein O-GlcNAc transferase